MKEDFFNRLTELRKEMIAEIKRLILLKGGQFSLVYTKTKENISICKAPIEGTPEEVKIAAMYVDSTGDVRFMDEEGADIYTSEVFTDDLYDIGVFLRDFKR